MALAAGALMAGISRSGWGKLASLLEGSADRLEKAQGQWVGTGVWYAHFPEFGTAKQPATPYFRPGLEDAARGFGVNVISEGGRKKDFQSVMLAPDNNVIEPLAEGAVRQIRAWIERRGIERTGALKASITHARTVEELERKSDALAAQVSSRAG